MKFTMRFAVILAMALVVCAALSQSNDLTVHEWGTFTSIAGENGAAVDWDALGCQSDLPQFVNDYGYRGFKWRLQGTVRMETPVLYFYSARELDAQVKVAFPQGLITEWYPKAESEVYQNGRRLAAGLNGIDTSLRSSTGAIEWKSIKVQPGTTPALPVESAPSRYYAARNTDAAPVAVDDQHEKFLFYRGVGRFPVPLSARVTDGGNVVVENRLQETVPNMFLFENRQGRIGYRSIGAGESDMPTLDGSLSQLRADLEAALIAQGLFPKEAQAMVETWRDSWFEEGARIIYIVPPSAVDAILPLQVTPTPSQTVRVFVGRIELITPATTHLIQSAVSRADWQAIGRYSRFLLPILRRTYPGDPYRVGQVEQQFMQSGFAGCGAPSPRSVAASRR